MLFVICVQFIPESARFNVSTGNTQAALNTLESIAKMNRSVMPEGRLVEPILVSSHLGHPPLVIQKEGGQCSLVWLLEAEGCLGQADKRWDSGWLSSATLPCNSDR